MRISSRSWLSGRSDIDDTFRYAVPYALQSAGLDPRRRQKVDSLPEKTLQVVREVHEPKPDARTTPCDHYITRNACSGVHRVSNGRRLSVGVTRAKRDALSRCLDETK